MEVVATGETDLEAREEIAGRPSKCLTPHSRKRTGRILSEPTHMEDEEEDQEDKVEDERDCEECKVESRRGIKHTSARNMDDMTRT